MANVKRKNWLIIYRLRGRNLARLTPVSALLRKNALCGALAAALETKTKPQRTRRTRGTLSKFCALGLNGFSQDKFCWRITHFLERRRCAPENDAFTPRFPACGRQSRQVRYRSVMQGCDQSLQTVPQAVWIQFPEVGQTVVPPHFAHPIGTANIMPCKRGLGEKDAGT